MKHRILVLGAGYAGNIATGRLARRLYSDDVEITLVNAEPDFVERVRMHQLAAGQDLPRHTIADMYAGTGVRVRIARVAEVDADSRTVTLDDGEELRYDTLVYGLGSAVADHGVPGVREHAYEVTGRAAALRVRDRLAAVAPGSAVLVVGGGLTGLEAVTEIAEAHPDLRVTFAVRGELGDWLSPGARRHLWQVFNRLGIAVREHTAVAAVESGGIVTADGERIAADVTVWTAGFQVHPIAAASTLEVADTGQIVVDRAMRSVSHPDVYAIGDAALAPGPGDKPLRMSCASGGPTGWQAAEAIIAGLTGRKMGKVPLGYTQQCISLGRRDGVIQFVTFDDRATSMSFGGRMAARYKEFICKGASWFSRHPVPYPTRRRHVTTPVQAPASAGA